MFQWMQKISENLIHLLFQQSGKIFHCKHCSELKQISEIAFLNDFKGTHFEVMRL